jgi:hypothetical protein
MVDYLGRSALSELISDMGVEITNLKKANEKLGQENNWLQQDVRGFFNGDISLSDMWDKLLKVGERLGVKGKNSKEIIDGVFDAIRKMNIDNELISKQNEVVMMEYNDLCSENDRLRAVVDDLAVKNREQNETIENLHKDNVKAWDRAADIITENRELKEEKDQALNVAADKCLEVTDLKKQVEELTRQNKILNENLDYARRHIEEACAVNLDLYKENEQLEKENSLLMEHNQEMIGERALWLETDSAACLKNVAKRLGIKYDDRHPSETYHDIERFAKDAIARAEEVGELKDRNATLDRWREQDGRDLEDYYSWIKEIASLVDDTFEGREIRYIRMHLGNWIKKNKKETK